MRILLLCLPLALAAAFLLGRASDPPSAAGAPATHVYTGRLYDVVRVPAASIRCDVNAEAGSTYLSCEHVPFSHQGMRSGSSRTTSSSTALATTPTIQSGLHAGGVALSSRLADGASHRIAGSGDH